MKKILLVLVLTLLMFGCGNAGWAEYNKAKPLMTVKEKVLMDAYKSSHSDYYDKTFTTIRSKRRLVENGVNEEGYVTILEANPPFCDVLFALEADERSMSDAVRNKTSILTQYDDSHGISLRSACKIYEYNLNPPAKVVEEETEDVLVVEVVEKEVTNYLPVEAYSAILSTVKACKIAKIKLSMMLDSSPLTYDDKDYIDKLVLTCAVDKLREELNK